MSNELTTLEHDIEQTRERLAHTIDELLHRIHPKTVVSREVSAVRGYFVDAGTGAPRTDNILKVAGGLLGTVALFVVVRKVAR